MLYGGASLVLFHQGVRHSADLDLVPNTGQERPSTEAITNSLNEGLQDISDVLGLSPLRLETEVNSVPELKINVYAKDDRRLFRVDFNKYGSVINSEVEVQRLEGVTPSYEADVLLASKELLLCHKAEAFMLRRFVKARDAYDIYDLQNKGAALTGNLLSAVEDTFRGEIDAEDIEERITKVTPEKCKQELESMLPKNLYDTLAEKSFEDLYVALRKLYSDWL
jgi:Nucleotidyl transferase AbiEii toxin, Type IV TA system